MPSGLYIYRGELIDMRGWEYPHPCFDEECHEILYHGHIEDGSVAKYTKLNPLTNTWETF